MAQRAARLGEAAARERLDVLDTGSTQQGAQWFRLAVPPRRAGPVAERSRAVSREFGDTDRTQAVGQRSSP